MHDSWDRGYLLTQIVAGANPTAESVAAAASLRNVGEEDHMREMWQERAGEETQC